MVAPVLIGASASSAGAHDHSLSDMSLGSLSIPQSALAVTVHVAAMLLVMSVVSIAVYETVGVSVLRHAGSTSTISGPAHSSRPGSSRSSPRRAER